jgi:hypothetical protein
MIKSALQSSLTNDIKYDSMSVGNLPSNEYLISTTVLSGTSTEVVFDVSGLGSQFRHLKLVSVVRGAGTDGINLQFNGDTGANYAAHVLFGNGSQVLSAAAPNISFMGLGLMGVTANIFGVSETDILDPFHTNKNTTIRVLVGQLESSPFVQLRSGFWNNTAAVTSLRVYPNSGSFQINSRFSLYGVTA